MRYLVALFAVAVLATPAKANDSHAAIDSLCNAMGTNVAISQCLQQNYQAVDRELNQVWQRVISEIRGNDFHDASVRKAWEKNLREAQRNWVRFKDRDCKKVVLYEWWGGSGAGGAISRCLIRHTVLRTDNLKERYFPQG